MSAFRLPSRLFHFRLVGLLLLALFALVFGGGEARAFSSTPIGPPLSITSAPVSTTQVAGQPVTFQVTASAVEEYAPITYQWFFNGEPIPGAAARKPAYRFVASLAKAGTYHVRVGSRLYTTVYEDSEPATLTVRQRPKITAQPANLTLEAGQPLSLSVSVTAYPEPTFQWFRNGEEIPEATSATFLIDAVEAIDTAAYRVRVTNALGEEFSRSVSVVVRSAPVIVDSPADLDATVGTPLRLSVTAYGFPKRSYQWRFNGEPIRDARSPVLVLKPTLARSGTYDVVVKNALGEAVSEPFVVTVYAAPKLLRAPTGAKRRVGQSKVFEVLAPAYPVPSYQWLKDGEELPGQTFSTLALSSLELEHEGLYSVRVSNSRGSLTTKPVRLRVSLAPYGPVHGSAYRFNTRLISDFGDSIRLNARFAINAGQLVVTDFNDPSVSIETLNFTRVSRDRVQMSFQDTEDGITITITFSFRFETSKSGTLVVSVYADGYGTVARGESSFTYTEPGL